MPFPAIRPWRSVRLPQAVTALALVVGLPIYLRTPPWCDHTLYDVAARNLLWGGVHYRDVFDTNLPGFLWVLTGIRWLFGFGLLPLRCADLAIVAGIVFLIDRLAKRGGATPSARWWAIAAVAVLYPSTVEMVHAQRDIWMALPVVAALLIRVRRAASPDTPVGRGFWLSVLEGALWGAAVWIKPHCILMAAGVWLVTSWRVASASPRRASAFAADLGGNILGGLVVGLAGIAWLFANGAWDDFWKVLTVWAPEYTSTAGQEREKRYARALHWFPPWSLWILPTIPLAVLSILDAAPWIGRPRRDDPAAPGPVGRWLPRWLWDREAGPDARFARGALAALYLVWAWQSFYIQRRYLYTHMTELFLMFGLWAAHRWAMPVLIFAWLTLTSAAWLVGDAVPEVRKRLLDVAVHDSRPAFEPDKEHYLVRHPLADPERLALWPECWRMGMTERETYALWDRTKRTVLLGAEVGWEELDEVADYLRSRGVGDYELIAWHDSPHALYLMLGVRPGLRFMHTNTVDGLGLDSRQRMRDELAATAGVARFVVSDLEFIGAEQPPERRLQLWGPPESPTQLLPRAVWEVFHHEFPFNQRTVFRSRNGLGRYVVHELTPPLGDSPRSK